jgi:hypothetical protein
MDKLRKFGMWLWQNKERMVLVFLVAVLAFRVYKVMTAQTELPADPKRPIDGPAPETPIPPDPVQDSSTESYQSLSQRNPFWYYGARPEITGNEGAEEEENIRLLNIQRSPDNQYVAQIQTQVTKWYREGEEFESYQLMRIDPENQQVEVYSGKSGTTLTLALQ